MQSEIPKDQRTSAFNSSPTDAKRPPRPVAASLKPPPGSPCAVDDPAPARLRILLPQGEQGITDCARQVFTAFAERRILFCRGGAVFRVERAGGVSRLAPVSPDAFRSELETLGDTYAQISLGARGIAETRKVPSHDHAKAILSCRLAGEILPPVSVIVAAPVLACDGERPPRLLNAGWHDFGGGVFVSGGEPPERMGLLQAIALIETLIADTDFQTPADRSRAIAAILSPALRLGGFIKGSVPVDFCEADQSQTGKGYRQGVIAAVYREELASITIRKGGVGSIDEDISSRLIAGRPFIQIDNIRGKLDSQLFENATQNIRPLAGCRAPHSAQILVDASPFFWFITTNGAETTIDAINRTLPVRIRKRPDGHKWKTFPEGDLLAHVVANQPRYLGAVHTIIREWHASGARRTDEGRHSFRDCVQACDHIVREYFGGAPLCDGIEEAKARATSPFLSWLRTILIQLEQVGRTGERMAAKDIAAFAMESDILPSNQRTPKEEDLARYIGTGMAKLFGNGDEERITRTLEGRTLTRVTFRDEVYRIQKGYILGREVE